MLFVRAWLAHIFTCLKEQILLGLELFFLFLLPSLFRPHSRLSSPPTLHPLRPPPSPPSPLPPPLPSSSISSPSPPLHSSFPLPSSPSSTPSLPLPLHGPSSESTSYHDLQCELPYAVEAATESVDDADTQSISDASTYYVHIEDDFELREFTIYPDEQGADRDPPLEVEYQRSFTGPYAITSSLADQKCQAFGVQGLLDELNSIMGAAHPLSPSLEFHLNRCISLNYDFGMAYSYFRSAWYSEFDTLATRMEEAEFNDTALRRDALDPSKKYLINPQLPPRRVWDIYSNRVIPYYWWGGYLADCLPVSHSWVAEGERSDTWSPINGCQWPIPVPKDSSLERVRIELLNYASSVFRSQVYSWLDVLCLRQAGQESDDAQRLDEWMTDVPTIGYLYRRLGSSPAAVVYFNGLGRPFCNGGYDNPRHWFSRTWTVQEAVSSPLLGGATPSSPKLKPTKRQKPPRSSGLKEFYLRFKSSFGKDKEALLFSQHVNMMCKRHATSELDRISGLASISSPRHHPIYDGKQSSEDAWEIYIKAIHQNHRAHLFFWCPVAGPPRHSWLPSWSQVMIGDTPAADGNLEGFSEIQYNDAQEEFCGNFIVCNDCLVHGLDFPPPGISSGSSVVRTGSITLASHGAELPRQHSVVADHKAIIEETARYTLLFPAAEYYFKEYYFGKGNRFVVGVRNDARQFQKLCVLDFVAAESYSDVKRIGSREDVVLI